MKKADLQKAYDGSYYTILGAGGDLIEWIDGYEKMLKKRGIGKPVEWFMCNGKDVNEKFSLFGDEQFQNDLTILLFPLDGLNVPKLAIFKIKAGDRWFDDIIDNSLHRQEEKLENF